MQDGNNLTGNIKDILDSIAEENKSEKETEFVFGKENEKSGLVFDDTEEAEAEPQVQFITVDSIPAERQTEFSVPEKFDANPKYDTQTEVDTGPRIYTTYVPTFTGVSDNYRMVNDPRPVTEKKTVVNNSVTVDDATREIGEDVDPTAEIDENVVTDNAKEVNMSFKDDEELESASVVFKFPENEISEEETEQTLITEEKTEESISGSVEEEADYTANENREYMLPDPVSETDAVVNYSNQNVLNSQNLVEETPSDVGDRDNVTSISQKSEYTSYSQRDSFKDKFIDSITSIRVRFFVALAISVLLLALESLYTFGVDVPALLNIATVPGAMALLDAQFILGIYIIALPETVKAFKNIIHGYAVPEISITVSFIISIAYTAIITVKSPSKYPLFGLLFAIPVIAAIGASYFKKSTEFSVFKIVAKNEKKYVIDKKYTRALEHENSAMDGVVEEHKSKICRMFSTAFVSDFFGRVEKVSENSKSVLINIGISFGAALVTGAVALFVPGGAVNAISAFALVFMLAYPAISIMSRKLPYYYSAKEAENEKSAVIGENALYDYSGVDVITFDDTDVFGAEDVTLQRIMLYGRSDNLTKALRQMSALFMNVGGPLDRLFSDSLDRKCPPADSTYIEDMGVRGEISGRPVLAGNLEYMRKNGVKIPEEELRQSESLSDSIKVIYAAEEGEIYAKFYIRYSFSEEFSMLLPTLYDEGIKLLVYTRDPNITNELLRTLTAGTDKIRVMRKYTSTESECVTYRKISSGLVTLGDKSNAINMILLAKKYDRLQNRVSLMAFVSMIAGASLALLISFTGLQLVPTLALAAWQAAWCGVLHFISAKTFRISKK